MDKFRLKKSVVYRKEEDGALIYDNETGNMLPLNETAAAMCELLFVDFKSGEECVEEIGKRWRVKDEERVKRDMERFVVGMNKLKFVEPAD